MPGGLAPYSLIVKAPWDAHVLAALALSGLGGAEFYVSGIDGGPRECAAAISFAEGDFDAVRSAAARLEPALKEELQFPADMGVSIAVERAAAPRPGVMSGSSLQAVRRGILQAPRGSQPSDGFARPYVNLIFIATGDGAVTLSHIARSASLPGQERLLREFGALADSIGARLDTAQSFPMWPYKAESPLRDAMAAAFRDFYGAEPSIEGTDAGLECAVFAQKMPGADFVSIGPDILDLHVPGERMSLPSYNRVYDYLAALLKKL
jgi:dipeptidase D